MEQTETRNENNGKIELNVRIKENSNDSAGEMDVRDRCACVLCFSFRLFAKSLKAQ